LAQPERLLAWTRPPNQRKTQAGNISLAKTGTIPGGFENQFTTVLGVEPIFRRIFHRLFPLQSSWRQVSKITCFLNEFRRDYKSQPGTKAEQKSARMQFLEKNFFMAPGH